MLLTNPLLLILPSLMMGKSFLFPISPSLSSPPPLEALPTAALLFNSDLMDIGQVYQTFSHPANQIVRYGKATFSKTVDSNQALYMRDLNNKKSSWSRKNQISLEMMRMVKRVGKENWDSVCNNAAMVKETRWDHKRMVARLGKRGGHLRRLVFLLGNSKRKQRILEAIQRKEVLRPMVDFLLGLATHHWEKKKQAKESQNHLKSFVAECCTCTPAAMYKFARVVR